VYPIWERHCNTEWQDFWSCACNSESPVRRREVENRTTMSKAADLLNVSHDYLVSRLETGAIPYRTVGTGRRVLFEHLMAYKKAEDEKRLDALNERMS
jgi:excisionase family DNA binding protein